MSRQLPPIILKIDVFGIFLHIFSTSMNMVGWTKLGGTLSDLFQAYANITM